MVTGCDLCLVELVWQAGRGREVRGDHRSRRLCPTETYVDRRSGHPSPGGGLAPGSQQVPGQPCPAGHSAVASSQGSCPQQNLPSPVPDTGGGQSQTWALPWSFQAGGGDPKVNFREGSVGREHSWLGPPGRMASEVASVLRLWLDPILGGNLESPFPSGASLPISPLHACSAGITTSRQPPLISPWVPAVTAVLTWRVTLRLLLLKGSACGLGIF